MTVSTGVTQTLPVTDLAGAGGLDDGVHDLLRERVVGEDLDADLGHEVDGVLRAAVDLGVALLAAVALHLADGHAEHADLLQRALHVLQHERLDDRGDQLHGSALRSGGRVVARREGGGRRGPAGRCPGPPPPRRLEKS
jgi:hypothetical protein